MIFICFAIFITTALTALILYKKSNKEKDINKILCLALTGILVFSIGLECSVFNINFYSSAKNVEEDVSHRFSSFENDDGSYTLPANEIIQIPEINQNIKNIRFDLSNGNPEKLSVIIYLTDEGNKYYFGNPERVLYKNVAKSQYINIHTAGNSQSIAFKFEDTEESVNLDSISINCNRPFEFSLLRIIIVFAILCLCYIFRASSPLFKRKITEDEYSKNTLVMGFLGIQCAIIIILGTINPVFMGIASSSYNSYKWDGKGIDFVELSMEHHNQYDELAQAILQGKTYIDNDDVPQSLIDMENPYDTTARSQQALLSGDEYRWDVAYFNGHYYVYFGIVPLLIMYLPFRLITNSPFPSAVGIMIFAFIFCIGVFKLLDLICKKHFKNVSVGVYLLTALTFVNCCGAMFLVKRPDFYSVPIITSMAFVIWGLYCWLKAFDCEKRKNLLFSVGSLCLALSVGCRPQSVLICLLALPLFLGYFFKDKHLFSKKGVIDLISLAVPVVVVASGIMYYNYIRFGSPFDFGSSYNLTTNDVTSRGLVFGRTGLGLFTYLFQPPQFTAVFPFIEAVDIKTNYIGKTITEYCFGGLITSLPFLWTLFLLSKVKATLKSKKLFAFTTTLVAIGIAIVVADTQAGGLLQRYYSDFGYIFFLAAAIITFSYCEEKQLENNAYSTNKLTKNLSFLSIFYSFALAFSVADVTIESQNPTLFGTIANLVQFWI